VTGTPWGEIVPDLIGAFGVLVAGGAAGLSLRATSKATGVSEALASIEQDRRASERVPKLSARLQTGGLGQSGFVLAVWLESPEPLARITAVVQEARNQDCPIGFKRGQYGVPNDLRPILEAEGIRPAWATDTLHPLASWNQRLAPGTPAVWAMELRRSAPFSAGADAVRFKALAYAERDDQHWEIPLPVTLTDNARDMIEHAGPEPVDLPSPFGDAPSPFGDVP
jgi:hypothetical protein